MTPKYEAGKRTQAGVFTAASSGSREIRMEMLKNKKIAPWLFAGGAGLLALSILSNPVSTTAAFFGVSFMGASALFKAL